MGENLKIKCNIDTETFSEKPAPFPGHLRKNLCRAESVQEVTPGELMAAIEAGQTFTPAAMAGTTGGGWISQQIICADIDNDTGQKDEAGRKIPINDPLTPDGARAIMAAHGIEPAFMYWTLSAAPTHPKFRIMLVLAEPLTDPAAAEDLTARFTGIFNAAHPHSADPTASDRARLYYGGRRGSVFYQSGSVTEISALQRLPIPAGGTAPQPGKPDTGKPDTGKPDTGKPDTGNPDAAKPDTAARLLDVLQAQFEHDKENFDMAGYITRTTNSKPHRIGRTLFFNPCPLCGHNNDFQITGSVYHCHGANGRTGGTIIDYLAARDQIDTGAALDKFKFEIMGYNRAEWKAAYKAAQARHTAPAGRPTAAQGAESDAGGDFTDHDGNAPKTGGKAQKMNEIDGFLSRITTTAYKPYQTGLNFFDDLLGGGVLRQTVLFLLAAPGTGKTTFCQQLAEGIARSRKPVIFLNLEMSRDQMLAKSISARATRNGADLSALDVLQGYKWDDGQRAAVLEAVEGYRREIAPYLHYNPDGVKGDLQELTKYLREQGKEAKAAGTPAPAVVLDYLHLVTTTQNIEPRELIKQTITEIKRYCIDFDTFAIVISATNRASNAPGKLGIDSGRDSSAIEYGGDALLSLSFEGDQEPKAEPTRRMKLKILKSRLYESGRTATVLFDAAHNIFFDAAPQKAGRRRGEGGRI
jgi:KaiC/GvpD/RAD55 family RecA-like ATPase